jgi:hypothetical protein
VAQWSLNPTQSPDIKTKLCSGTCKA